MKHLLNHFLAATLLTTATTASAENWPQWRGPFFNGSTTETGLPTTTNHIAWVTPLPGYSGATPAIWGDNVFVSSPDDAKNLLLLCLDRRSGKIRWQKILGNGDFAKGHNNATSPSPITDGQRVWIMYATGLLAALDLNGNVLWKRDLAADYGKFALMWIYGSSPLLYRNNLYVQVLQRHPPTYKHALDDKPTRDSYLLCLDPLTGKERWRHIRHTDAITESMEAYTTPIPHGDEIILIGGDYITAHDAATGAERWRCGGLNPKHNGWWRVVPSPVIADDTIIACGPKRSPVLGIRNGKPAWESTVATPDCCTPLFYKGNLFVLDGDRQLMACVDPKTGAVRWQGKLDAPGDVFRASPTGADDKVYCVSEKGTVFVLEAGDRFQILSTFQIAEPPIRSSIAIAQGQLFLRTGKNLYCFGAQ